ncbi:hypothetical protein BT69DRAFT_1289896 [Atractiella rhizophila]|nr:hypothetical protein BT69DRAFT_1289896 [Atractiella rhizophila]
MEASTASKNVELLWNAQKGNCVKTSSRSFCSCSSRRVDEKHNDVQTGRYQRSGPLNATISATPFRRVVSISIYLLAG